jgi:perosamine synthetase
LTQGRQFDGRLNELLNNPFSGYAPLHAVHKIPNSASFRDMTNPTIRDSVLQAVSEVLGTPNGTILLHEPYFPEQAWTYVKECLDTRWVSSAGKYVSEFENRLAEMTGSKRAVAVVNGTAALQVSLILAGVNRDDEVICPALTFVATANAISHSGAIPHFVDVCESRLAISPLALENRLQEIARREGDRVINRMTGRRIGAVCVMHCFGHPADLDSLAEVCERYGLPLVEDAAESLGSYYKGQHTGRHGQLAAVSFNGNKIVTTGGGGAILTDRDDLADRAKHLTTTGKLPHAWQFNHDAVAWNYRLPNLNAALGLAQLEVMDKLLVAKRELAVRYERAFAGLGCGKFLKEPADSQSNYWLNALVLNPEFAGNQEELLEALNQKGFQSRPLWTPMHHLPMYRGCPQGELSVTDSLFRRVINVPSSATLLLK